MNPTIIYSDGACSGNPGTGGWASIILLSNQTVVELGARVAKTTNNQMELSGVIEALKYLGSKKSELIILTDSTYVIRGATQWVYGWMRNNWKTAEGNEVANKDYWIELHSAMKPHKVEWRYVRGHTGIAGNERCDQIAVSFTEGKHVDLYEGSLKNYFTDLSTLPPFEKLPEMKPKGEKAQAHSYLSLIGNIAMKHSNWADCERRVKGQSGAKFKKAMSSEEEAQILKSWGVDPSQIK